MIFNLNKTFVSYSIKIRIQTLNPFRHEVKIRLESLEEFKRGEGKTQTRVGVDWIYIGPSAHSFYFGPYLRREYWDNAPVLDLWKIWIFDYTQTNKKTNKQTNKQTLANFMIRF